MVARARDALQLLHAGASEDTAWDGPPTAADRDASLILLRAQARADAVEAKREDDDG